MRPWVDELARRDTIPGGDRQTAAGRLAEIGAEMPRCPSAAHLAAWAGMCPGNPESAGQRTSGQTRQGSRGRRRVLTEAARGAARAKQPGRSALAGDDRRRVARRGKKKAAIAVGHRLLSIADYVPRDRQDYREPMVTYPDEPRRLRVRNRARDPLRQLGCEVTLTPPGPAA